MVRVEELGNKIYVLLISRMIAYVGRRKLNFSEMGMD